MWGQFCTLVMFFVLFPTPATSTFFLFLNSRLSFPPTSILSLELLCLPLFSSFFLLQCPDQHIPRITLSPFLLQLPLISHWKYIDFFLNGVSNLNSKGLLIQVLIWQREERGRSLNSSKSGSRDIKVIILSFIFFLQNTFSREKIQRTKSYC